MKEFLGKEWYFVVMAVLSVINAIVRLLVQVDGVSIFWLVFAIFWLVWLGLRWRDYVKSQS